MFPYTAAALEVSKLQALVSVIDLESHNRTLYTLRTDLANSIKGPWRQKNPNLIGQTVCMIHIKELIDCHPI